MADPGKSSRSRLPTATLIAVTLIVTHAMTATANPEAARELWSLQPLRAVSPPTVSESSWPRAPVDSFILAALDGQGMRPSKSADRTTLIRRVHLDLVGLPPAPSDTAAFVGNTSPDAFERLVDRLLASPRYGERWGRHWLDVARYADTKGYFFAEDPRYPYAYTYRDYVIDAFNRDLPYGRFIAEQLAADKLSVGDDKGALAAMGFLTLGRRFDGDPYEIIDDRIDVVCRGLMALTVTCARCHDHKYDPIPTADYYSLYGVFASSAQPESLPLLVTPKENKAYLAYRDQVKKHEDAYFGLIRAERAKLVDHLRLKVGEYLTHVLKPEDDPDAQVYLSYAKGELRAPIVVRWRRYLERVQRHPVFIPWHSLKELAGREFNALRVLRALEERPADEVNPLVVKALIDRPPRSMPEVAELYGRVFADYYQRHKKRAKSATDQPASSPAEEEVLSVLLDPGTPTTITLDDAPGLVNRSVQNDLWPLKKALQAFNADSPGAPPRATVLTDVADLVQPRVFLRGDPRRLGPAIPRRWLGLLSAKDRKPFEGGSGRLEVAQAIASKENPLTHRVLVNRTWMRHIGKALVRTVGDFGSRSDPPTHPDLLDYMTREFLRREGSRKQLHRLILLSSTYRQGSDMDATNHTRDPENRFVWRMNPRRLDWESLRDSLLSVSGRLDLEVGGRPVDVLTQPFSGRRTVYAFVDRQYLPGVFRVFDFASPDASTPRRHQTTVPQQALFLMNSPFVIETARHLAKRPEIATRIDSRAKIRALYKLVFSRAPEPDEVELALSFLNEPGQDSEEELSPIERFSQVLLLTNDFSHVE